MEANTMQQHDEQQLVVFRLSTESYGVDIAEVREILQRQEIARVPRTPEFMEGVINLRGGIVPVIDLRKRFNLPVPEETRDNRVVVVDIGGQDIGVIVDSVTEVLRIKTKSVEPPSSVITTTDSAYLLGIAKLNDRPIILLDLNQVFSESEQALIEEMGEEMARPAA